MLRSFGYQILKINVVNIISEHMSDLVLERGGENLKNTFYFIIGIATLLLGFVLLIIKESYSFLGLVGFGIILLVHWNTISYRWACSKCGSIFDISMFQNFIGINGGINHKYLYCPNCMKRTWCNGVPKGNQSFPYLR